MSSVRSADPVYSADFAGSVRSANPVRSADFVSSVRSANPVRSADFVGFVDVVGTVGFVSPTYNVKILGSVLLALRCASRIS